MNSIFYKKDINFFLNKLINNEHFKYSRFNDGEYNAIIGNRPNACNCDGHQYFPEMGIELKNILLNYNYDNNYIIESFDYWHDLLPHISDIMNQLTMMNTKLRFLNTDFIRIAHEQTPEKFIQLLEILKTKKIVIVGPYYLKKLDKFLEFRFIEVPLKNCYLHKNRIIKEIEDINSNESDIIYLFSSSMPTKIFIDAFKNDKNNTYIDWGSVWDTFFISPEYNFIRKRSTSNNMGLMSTYTDYLI